MTDVRAIAVERVDRRNGYAIEFAHSPEAVQADYEAEVERLLTGAIFVTPSGRCWRVEPPSRFDPRDRRWLEPLGDDVRPAQTGGQMNGGVRRRLVDVSRLDGFDRVWKVERLNL